MMQFEGYRRPSGRFGVRNHVLIFPTVICASAVAGMISRQVPGTVCVNHPHGCGHLGDEKEHMIRTMSGFCANPNVAGVLLVGLGCELITPETIAEELEKAHQRFEIVNIQALGGTIRTAERGKALAEKLLRESAGAQRQPVDVSELILGTHCGGSDTLSGLTANPALGAACDLLVEAGGTVIISETPEMLGAEHILARRAVSDEVRSRILEITSASEARFMSMGVDIRGTEPSPGNIDGGLTTLEEKSLGAIRKGGTSPVVEVVDYAQMPSRRGLVVMDGPAHDVVSNTGMISAGAQVIAFTTGRGTPIGSPVAPVLKISSNSDLCRLMMDNIDIDAGAILEGDTSIQEMGEQIAGELVEVASGKLVRAELLGHNEFAIHTIGPTV